MAILILLAFFLLNEITLKTHKQYHNFEMLSRLNELDLCGLFLTELYSRSGCHLVKKKSAHVQLVRAFQSCQGVWHYLWVFRVCLFYCAEQGLH